VQAARFCETCGTARQSGERFCTNCGEAFPKNSEPPPPPDPGAVRFDSEEARFLASEVDKEANKDASLPREPLASQKTNDRGASESMDTAGDIGNIVEYRGQRWGLNGSGTICVYDAASGTWVTWNAEQLLSPPNHLVRLSHQAELSAVMPTGDSDAQVGTKVCPDCAEDVKTAARVCRYCGYRFDVRTNAESEESSRIESGLLASIDGSDSQATSRLEAPAGGDPERERPGTWSAHQMAPLQKQDVQTGGSSIASDLGGKRRLPQDRIASVIGGANPLQLAPELTVVIALLVIAGAILLILSLAGLPDALSSFSQGEFAAAFGALALALILIVGFIGASCLALAIKVYGGERVGRILTIVLASAVLLSWLMADFRTTGETIVALSSILVICILTLAPAARAHFAGSAAPEGDQPSTVVAARTLVVVLAWLFGIVGLALLPLGSFDGKYALIGVAILAVSGIAYAQSRS
jgi:ribosomal protein L32